ncbi:hypothetical protein Tco_0426074 [Tanacetum coccineum]
MIFCKKVANHMGYRFGNEQILKINVNILQSPKTLESVEYFMLGGLGLELENILMRFGRMHSQTTDKALFHVVEMKYMLANVTLVFLGTLATREKHRFTVCFPKPNGMRNFLGPVFSIGIVGICLRQQLCASRDGDDLLGGILVNNMIATYKIQQKVLEFKTLRDRYGNNGMSNSIGGLDIKV